jgi:hypothetical protein
MPRPESDESYYRRRAVEEQAAAGKATSASARELHEELADMYLFRAMVTTIPGPPARRSGHLEERGEHHVTMWL